MIIYIYVCIYDYIYIYYYHIFLISSSHHVSPCLATIDAARSAWIVQWVWDLGKTQAICWMADVDTLFNTY